MSVSYRDTWDLEVFFAGGSESEAFRQHLEETKTSIEELNQAVAAWSTEQEELVHIYRVFAHSTAKLRQAGAFVSCLRAQDTRDQKAGELRAVVNGMSASIQNVLAQLNEKLLLLDEAAFEALFANEELGQLEFVIRERRERAQELLPAEQEALLNQLSVDGYQGWGQMYDDLVASIQIEVGGSSYSVGQAQNLLSHADRAVREEAFRAWEKAWGEKAPLFARTLNHLAGFRLSVYDKRGWEDVLKEPLDINRMQKKTLDSMWRIISSQKDLLVRYMERKAQLLGVDKLTWYDLDAPVSAATETMSYQQGAEFIIQQFEKFGPELAAFTKKAFADRWIEAEDRAYKAPGGFCTSFPESGQSRIFMTYSGTPSNVSTLAHELGHAFHSYALKETHPLNRNYAMNVAETASTFAEMIVADASVKQAKTDEERLALLEDKVQRSVALLMNIHARFLFETRFYEERLNGIVSLNRLNELMQAAQQEAYGDGLAEYHPLFWASKLHFFITGVPFYNFPYTFGYLFSLGIYARALEEGAVFEAKYMNLLEDTGSMTVEDLAAKHLGVDLTGTDFWESAVAMCLKDVEEFLLLTEQRVQQKS